MSHADRHDDCPVTVFQRVGVEATVTITPQVSCGPLTVTCLTGRITPCLEDDAEFRMEPSFQPCRVTVFQELSVAVPVHFGARAACSVNQVASGDAAVEPADSVPYLPDAAEGSDGSASSSCSDSSSSSGTDT